MRAITLRLVEDSRYRIMRSCTYSVVVWSATRSSMVRTMSAVSLVESLALLARCTSSNVYDTVLAQPERRVNTVVSRPAFSRNSCLNWYPLGFEEMYAVPEAPCETWPAPPLTSSSPSKLFAFSASITTRPPDPALPQELHVAAPPRAAMVPTPWMASLTVMYSAPPLPEPLLAPAAEPSSRMEPSTLASSVSMAMKPPPRPPLLPPPPEPKRSAQYTQPCSLAKLPLTAPEAPPKLPPVPAERPAPKPFPAAWPSPDASRVAPKPTVNVVVTKCAWPAYMLPPAVMRKLTTENLNAVSCALVC